MSSAVEQIKARLDIAEVVGSYVKLEKAGANLKARCPFHNEKTASFYVSPARQSYHCFGCNKGGDMFSFVQEIEGVNFLQALETLAFKAGIEIDSYDGKHQSETKRLYALMEEAVKFYENRLREKIDAKEYLLGRGLREETIAKFRIGFAPAEWRSLSDYLKRQGYTEEEMVKTGLVVKVPASATRSGGVYDRFRSRIMFPLADASGRIIGFSGRIFGQADEVAKYINTPQTVLYDKSRVLYGYDKAKLAIKQADCCILVEGQMDLIMAQENGSPNTVAVSGTALTEYHLSFINRLTSRLVMAFDGDLAGIKAAKRGVDLALGLGLEVIVAELPLGMDPADVIKENPSGWLKAVEQAKHFIDFYLSVLSKRGYDDRTLKLTVSKEVIPYVARLTNALEQSHFVSKIAKLLSVGEGPVWEEVKKVVISAPADSVIARTAQSERVSRRQLVERKIFGIILWLDSAGKSSEISAGHEDLKSLLGGDEYEQRRVYYTDNFNDLVLETELYYEGHKDLRKELAILLNDLKQESLKEDLERVTLELRRGEQEGDEMAIQQCLKKMQEITININNLKRQ